MLYASPHPRVLCLLQSLDAAPELAHAVAPPGLLADEERMRYESFRVLKRRRDWLLGRWTAKHLVREHLTPRNPNLGLDQIIIRAEPDGSPYPTLAGERLPVSLSISHSGAYSFCALTDEAGATAGADIELIEPRPLSLATQFFTRAELNALLAAPEEERAARMTLVWSAKEAFLKCIKEGLRVDTRAIAVEFPESLAGAGEWAGVRVTARADVMRPESAYRGWWRLEGETILNLGILRS